jgi:hypothetical protein
MRKQMLISFVLGIALGLSCWMLYANFSVTPMPTARALDFGEAAEVRFVPVRNVTYPLATWSQS